MITHYPSCNASYPEKIREEDAQHITEIDLEDSIIRQCVDCGAFEEVSVISDNTRESDSQ